MLSLSKHLSGTVFTIHGNQDKILLSINWGGCERPYFAVPVFGL